MTTRPYRLSEKERVFLVHTCVSADRSLKEIAARSGLREHNVRYIRDNLLQEELIQPVYFIDMYRLGLIDLGVFFSRGAETSAGRKKLEQNLQNAPSVTWLAKMGGAYQYGMTVQLAKMHDAPGLYEMIRPTEPGGYFSKTVRVGWEWHSFSPNFLCPKIRQRSCVTVTTRNSPIEVDETDLLILRTVAAKAGKSRAEMARAAQMNVNSFDYRFEKLTEKGIIKTMGYVMANERLGIHVYRLLIADRGLTKEQRGHLLKMIASHPEVGAIILCTGNWDFELRLETENPSGADTFAQLLYDRFGHSIDSITCVQQHKVLKRRGFPVPSPA